MSVNQASPFEKSFICNKCYIGYTQQTDLDCHLLTDHNNLNICNRCNLIFFDRRTLKRHNRKQHNLKHSCIFCCKAYKGLMYRRKEHDKTLYQCKYCHKAFHTSKKLYNHLHIHRKPFMCAICPETFNTKSSMRLHLINEHLEKPCCWVPSLENYAHFKNLTVK